MNYRGNVGKPSVPLQRLTLVTNIMIYAAPGPDRSVNKDDLTPFTENVFCTISNFGLPPPPRFRRAQII